jgi:hypothetical protein
MRILRAAFIVAGLLVISSHPAFAQGSITGVVRDSSGSVLPGVTVEASSPVLIEKVRTAVTDGNGVYRLLDLRAGTYVVTFALSGFNTFKREGIELTGAFTANVNAEMRVGKVEETVMVSAETPIVDVQSVRRQTVIDSDLITAIPAARTYGGLLTLMPNVIQLGGSAQNTQVVPQMVVFGSSGGRTNEGRLDIDGLSVGSAFNGAGVSAYIADVTNAQEVALTSSGGLGEAEVGGPSLNVVPREGGNLFRGSFYGSGVTERMVDSNYTQELEDRGLSTPGQYQKIWDYNVGIGGPIARDRFWFFGTFRDEGSHRTIPGTFANLNAGDPTKWTFVADPTRPAVAATSSRNIALRLTGQVTQRNKVAFFWDEQIPCEGAALAGLGDSVDACRHSGPNEIIAGSAAPTPTAGPGPLGLSAPETAGYRDYGQRVRQARWTSPVSGRLLLEAGVGQYRSRYGGKLMPGANTEDLIRVVEQCATSAGCANNGGIANLTYRSANWSSNVNHNINWRSSATYILGTQTLKVGYQGAYLEDERKNFSNTEFLQYRTQNGIPDQITMTINRFPIRQRVRYDAIYLQDQWTLGRITLQGALRYDHAWSYFPEQQVGPVRFFPNAVVYPETKGVEGYHDLTPRGGAAIDLFGDGKTSLKVNAGRYLEAAQNGGLFTASNPTNRLATTTNRQWTDVNSNRIVDCDLLNPLAQGPVLTSTVTVLAVDSCGTPSNVNFGREVFDSRLDDALVSGWDVRPGDWQFGVAVQREIVPRVSVEVGYQRRWLVNFTAIDNFNRSVEDHTVFGVNVPSDSRLPDGGGYVLNGLYNVTQPASLLLQDNVTTLASNYGKWRQVNNSINLNVRARPRNGLALQGGFNYGRTKTDRCEVRAAIPEMSPLLTPTITPTNPWCEYSIEGFRVTGLGSYVIPKVDVQVAGTFRSEQGGDLAANWAAPNSQTVGLNRQYAGVAGSTVQVNLIEPGTLYGDRVNQVDLRVAKILRFGRTRTNVGFDVYNITNANPVLTYNESFNPSTTTWLTPQSVLQSRFAKFSVQFDF